MLRAANATAERRRRFLEATMAAALWSGVAHSSVKLRSPAANASKAEFCWKYLAQGAIREAPDLHPQMMAGVLELDGGRALRETAAVPAVHARVRHGAPH